MPSLRQIEQGAHYIRKCLIYLMKKAFLERAVLEVVHKFDKKFYHKCLKGESIAKVCFVHFLWSTNT